MTREEELRLVAAAVRGDEFAFEQLVTDNQRLVYNLALKLTGSPDDALDVSQDVFLKAYQNLKSFRGESRISVWLYRLTYNAGIDYIKKMRSPGTVSLDGASEDDDSPAIDVPDSRPLPEEAAQRRELQLAVRSAIAELDDDKREVIILRELKGLSYAEISEQLGIECGTVKSRIARARAALGEILKKRGTFSDAPPSNNMKGGR